MRLLRVTVQYPRKASTLEPRGSEVAGVATLTEGMEETPDVSTVWEVRGRVLRRGFQAGWDHPSCGPHCAGEAHSTIEGWNSRSPRKPSVFLRNLPWLSAECGPQAWLGHQTRLPGGTLTGLDDLGMVREQRDF